jgi:hypothetical protein
VWPDLPNGLSADAGSAIPPDDPDAGTLAAPLMVADAATARERQEAARNVYLASVEAGRPLTGADLGRQFGRTDRWGRMQIQKFRADPERGNTSGNGRRRRDLSAARNGTGALHTSARRNGTALSPSRQANGSNTARPPHDGVVPLVNRSDVPAGRKPDRSASGTGTELSATDQAEQGGPTGRPGEPAPQPR